MVVVGMVLGVLRQRVIVGGVGGSNVKFSKSSFAVCVVWPTGLSTKYTSRILSLGVSCPVVHPGHVVPEEETENGRLTRPAESSPHMLSKLQIPTNHEFLTKSDRMENLRRR